MTKLSTSVVTARHRCRTEKGSGLIGTVFGMCAFLAFMTLAVNTLVGLYAVSVATAIGNDVVHGVAALPEPRQETALNAADASARRRLEGFGNVELQWLETDGSVGLRVTADRPSLLPRSLARRSALTTIDRTVWARREVLR